MILLRRSILISTLVLLQTFAVYAHGIHHAVKDESRHDEPCSSACPDALSNRQACPVPLGFVGHGQCLEESSRPHSCDDCSFCDAVDPSLGQPVVPAKTLVIGLGAVPSPAFHGSDVCAQAGIFRFLVPPPPPALFHGVVLPLLN